MLQATGQQNIFCVSTKRPYHLYMVYSYFLICGVLQHFYTHTHTHTLDWSHKGRGSHVRNIWAYSQQQCQQSWLSKQRLRPTRTRTHRKSHINTHTCSEEINDCDLLHLIAHKPGPSTCSNNFWLSHLSKFARMCQGGWATSKSRATNEHLRSTVPPINLRPPEFDQAQRTLH